jgi:hypothetical protein
VPLPNAQKIQLISIIDDIKKVVIFLNLSFLFLLFNYHRHLAHGTHSHTANSVEK